VIENSNHVNNICCQEMESLAILYSCDELEPAARAALEAHAAQCSACAAVLSREGRLLQAIASFEQPADSMDRSDLLLAQCRSELAEAIDDRLAKANQPGWRAIFSPAALWTAFRDTLVFHPALSMAVLTAAAFLAGYAGKRLPLAPAPMAARANMTVSATPKLTDQQLQSAASANIAWVTPSGSRTPTVQVQLMSPTPTNLVGAPDDTDIERALTYVLQNGERFDPGARLDSLDVLRSTAADPDVRRALCTACRTDRNPGVRMKALESLEGYEQDPAVRQTLVDVLRNDGNVGVRVEAINLLVSALRAENTPGPADPQLLGVLRDRLHNDPNNYIRLQSAAALRELGEQ
jgi:hypothetical protein